MTTTQAPLLLYGDHCSPYTRKMLSLLRYRRISYQLLQGGPGGAPQDLPKPRVGLLPTFYLSNESGDLEAHVDSTPLIRQFEQDFEQRSAIPPDPALDFVNYLLEDYGDEWLTKAMFHFRWAHKQDGVKAGAILPLQHAKILPEHEHTGQTIYERQVSRLYVVGSNETTAEVIENSYRDFLSVFDHILSKRAFLFGDRPGAADFAFYGQLTQLAGFDPTPMQLTLETAPRVYAWTNIMDDLSGLDIDMADWYERDQLLESFRPLLTEVGQTYVPVMLGNTRTLANGDKEIYTTVRGRAWEQPAFAYHARCLQWLQNRYLELTDSDRQWVDTLLSGTGCEALFSDQ